MRLRTREAHRVEDDEREEKAAKEDGDGEQVDEEEVGLVGVTAAAGQEPGQVADRQLDRDPNAVEDQDELEVPACVRRTRSATEEANEGEGDLVLTHDGRQESEGAGRLEQHPDVGVALGEADVCDATDQGGSATSSSLEPRLQRRGTHRRRRAARR